MSDKRWQEKEEKPKKLQSWLRQFNKDVWNSGFCFGCSYLDMNIGQENNHGSAMVSCPCAHLLLCAVARGSTLRGFSTTNLLFLSTTPWLRRSRWPFHPPPPAGRLQECGRGQFPFFQCGWTWGERGRGAEQFLLAGNRTFIFFKLSLIKSVVSTRRRFTTIHGRKSGGKKYQLYHIGPYSNKVRCADARRAHLPPFCWA